MNIELFHAIGDPDSALVRQALVQKNLTDTINFRNIAYESHAETLKEITGRQIVPTLIIDGRQRFVGKDEILAWIHSQPGS